MALYVKLSLMLSIIIFFTVPPSIVTGDFTLERWKYFREVRLAKDLSSPNFVGVPIPNQLFGKAAQGLKDLRIIRDNSHEEPYKLEISRETVLRKPYPTRIQSVGGSHSTTRSSWAILDLGSDGIPHNEVDIRTSTEVFAGEPFKTILFIISTSSDNNEWTQIHEGVIFNWSSYNDGDSKQSLIRYPDSTSRYLRVFLIPYGAFGELEIDGSYKVMDSFSLNKGNAIAPPSLLDPFVGRASISHTAISSIHEIEYPVESTVNIKTLENKSTQIVLNLKSENRPSHRLSIDTSERHFFRNVILEESNDLDFWNPIVPNGTFYSLEAGEYQESKLSLHYPETDSRYFRLTIMDGDNLPLEGVNNIRIWGAERKAIFFAHPNSNYKFYYGNDTAQAPTYDIAQFFSSTGGMPLFEAFFNSEVENNKFQHLRKPLTERYPWLLGTLVGVASIILASLSLKVFRKSNEAVD